jgi:Tol biopolymer transport system component
METNVWSVRADTGIGKLTSEWELLTHGPTPKQRPNISQDGSRVIFDDGPTEVVLDLATGKQRMISRERTFHSSLTADGKKAAFARFEGKGFALFVDDMSGDVPQRVCADCGMPPAGWSTDQQKILFDAGVPQALGLFNLKTGTKIDLLRQPGRAFTQASFAPGDRWILFLAGAGPGRQQVFVMPYSEGAAVPKEEAWIPITDGKALDSQPRWSPDGKVVYYLSDRDGSRCLWARRLDPTTKQPGGEPFAVSHFHSAALSPANIGAIGLIGLGVARDRIVLNMGRSSGNIWIATPAPNAGQRGTTESDSN